MSAENIGLITQVIGSTFDVEFPEDKLPAIYNAIKINSNERGVDINLTGEVQQHLGGGRVRGGAELRGGSGTIDGVKVLGNGELTAKLTVKAAKFSQSAVEKIEKAGGKTEVM